MYLSCRSEDEHNGLLLYCIPSWLHAKGHSASMWILLASFGVLVGMFDVKLQVDIVIRSLSITQYQWTWTNFYQSAWIWSSHTLRLQQAVLAGQRWNLHWIIPKNKFDETLSGTLAKQRSVVSPSWKRLILESILQCNDSACTCAFKCYTVKPHRD